MKNLLIAIGIAAISAAGAGCDQLDCFDDGALESSYRSGQRSATEANQASKAIPTPNTTTYRGMK